MQSKFWNTMSNSLVVYDHILRQKNIHLALCDNFYDGAYIPSEEKIILCVNTLTRQKDFNNAANRMLIKMYDHKRSENYNFDNCKHLACTEVRAA